MNGLRPHRLAVPPLQAGRSLIELLVAMVIGFIILGSVMLTSLGGNLSSTRQNAQSRLNDEASIISNVLNWHLRVAGYSTIRTYLTPSGNEIRSANRNYMGPAVLGCENGIANLGAADFTQINCAGGGAGATPDAFAVMYEADNDNTIPTGTGIPSDCVGQGVPDTTPSDINDGSTYRLAENRFYLQVNAQTGQRALYCAGSGNVGVGVPLVDNVLDMQITYGVADVPSAAQTELLQIPFFEPVMYLRADQVLALPLSPPTTEEAIHNWRRVVSMRICLLLASEPNAMDQATPYTDCNGNVVMPAANDLRYFRTVTINTGFKNRTPACSDANAAPAGTRPNPSRCAF